MKKYILLLSALFIAVGSYATIHRVSPDPDAQADFLTLQAAHDAASAGDTIFIEPTKTNLSSQYGSVTVVKRLTFLGPGYFFKENYPDFRIANYFFSTSAALRFDPGSEGSVVKGCQISAIALYANNIQIIQNKVGGSITFYGVTNILIRGNYLFRISENSGTNTAIISNNILTEGISGFDDNDNIIITNNVLGGISITHQTVSNNIAYKNIDNLFNCILSNNIDARPGAFGFGTANGNQGGFALTAVLVADPYYTQGNHDTAAQLANGSPAIGTGFGGEDCGAFGGNNPYVLSGLQSMPFFTDFTNPGIASDTQPLKTIISIEAK